MSYLIWERGLKGPVAAKWTDKPDGKHAYWRHLGLSSVHLTSDDDTLSIDELMRKYPAPKRLIEP